MFKLTILSLLIFTNALHASTIYRSNIFTDLDVSASRTPWHFYFYPLSGNEMFAESDSPLQKLKRISLHPERIQSVIDQMDQQSSMRRPHWMGKCHALGLASLLRPIRNCSVRYQGEIFTRVDQRALLSLIHEDISNHDQEVFLGRRGTRGRLSAIDFHNYLHHFINSPDSERLGFLLDVAPGEEIIWQPAYKVEIRPISMRNQSRFFSPGNYIEVKYRVYVHMAKQSLEFRPNELLALEPLTEVETYEYSITYRQEGPSTYSAMEGNWDSHNKPQYLYAPLVNTPELRSFNRYVPVNKINAIMSAPCAR